MTPAERAERVDGAASCCATCRPSRPARPRPLADLILPVVAPPARALGDRIVKKEENER